MYVAEKASEGPTATSPLYPFYKGKGNDDVWNSLDAQDWKQCGFAVPGTNDKDKDQVRREVMEYLKTSYFWLSTKEAPPSDLNFPKDMDHVEALIGSEPRKPPKTFAIKVATGKKDSGLVQRTLPLDATPNEAADQQAVTAKILTTLDKSAFPKGTLEGSKERTWNVHLTVRK